MTLLKSHCLPNMDTKDVLDTSLGKSCKMWRPFFSQQRREKPPLIVSTSFSSPRTLLHYLTLTSPSVNFHYLGPSWSLGTCLPLKPPCTWPSWALHTWKASSSCWTDEQLLILQDITCSVSSGETPGSLPPLDREMGCLLGALSQV